jgi:hypothetical protein
MTSTSQRLLGIIVGSAVAIAIVRMLEELAKQVTMPPGVDPTNVEQVKAALERGEFPFASLALVLCGWLLAAYAGCRVAMHIGHARIVGLGFTMVFTAVILRDLTLLPHPTWMWIGGALGVPLVALGAAGETITVRGL